MGPFEQAWTLLKASDISMATPFDYMMADPDYRQYGKGGYDPSQGEMPVMLNFDVGGSGEAKVDDMGTFSNPYGPRENNKGSDFRVDDFDELAIQHLLHGAFQQAPIVNAMASIGEDVSGFPRVTTGRGGHPLRSTRFARDPWTGEEKLDEPMPPLGLSVGEPHPEALDPIRSTLGMPSQRGLSAVEQQEADRRAAEAAAQAAAAKQARASAQVQAANAKRLASAKAAAEARRANQPKQPDMNAAMEAIKRRQRELGLR